MLIFYQIKFISKDITTSEYLRMDKYATNLFDEGFKNNLKKFFFDKDNYEKELVYNENAKQIINKTILVKEYIINFNYNSNDDRKNKNLTLPDEEKKDNFDISTNDYTNDCTNETKLNNTSEYFQGDESKFNKLSEK
jgi:hypothetical protein